MTKTKWIIPLICLCLLISPQFNVSARRTLPQTPDPRDPEIIRQLITGDPIQFYSPSDHPQPGLDPQWTPDPVPPSWSILAFQSFRFDNWDIYTVHPSGVNESRLTNSPSTDSNPSLSRGGEWVLFSSNRSGNNDIYLENNDGSGLIPIVTGAGSEIYPGWSPDNSWIAFQSNNAGNYDIYVVGANGLSQLTNSPAYDGEPTWSPDGTQLAFVSERSGLPEIWAMNVDGTNLRQLTSGATAATPAWSPLGDKIAYANDDNGDGFYRIFTMNADGSQPTILGIENYVDHDYWNPSWSPDGKWLGVINTYWIKRDGSWYWYNSNLLFSEINGGSFNPLTDDLVWKVSWATTDTTPPGPCTLNLRAYQSWESFFLSWNAVDEVAGTAFYDIQVRDLPGGAWRDFLTNTPQSSGLYPGMNGQKLEFRCRGRDAAFNTASWDQSIPAATVVDTGRPTSQVMKLPQFVKGNHTTVIWSGKTTTGNITGYDIFVRDGAKGDWTMWIEETPATSADFIGTPGHTYFFRSQAHDSANRSQIWQPDAQAAVTFYSSELSAQVNDIRGFSLPASSITTDPAPVYEDTGQSPFELRFRTISNSELASVFSPGLGTLPATALDTTIDRAFTFVMPPIQNEIANSGFEDGSFGQWDLKGDGFSISPAIYHTGLYSARLVPGAGGSSEISQTITIAVDLQNPTLSFLYNFAENPDNSQFNVAVDGDTSETVLTTQAQTAGWTHVWADLSAFAGQEVTLRLQISGNGGGVYIDEVTVGSWQTPIIQQISPAQWPAGQVQSIILTGQNFSGASQVFLNEFQLTDVQLLDENHISALTLTGMQGGCYRLRVVSPEGVASMYEQPIVLTPLPIYIPLVTRPGAQSNQVLPSSWLTLGYDDHHSGFSPNAVQASRYSKIWTVDQASSPYQVVAADGIVITTHTAFSQEWIQAYDLTSGNQVWNIQFPGTFSISPASISNGAVYFFQSGNDGSYLFCLDLHTGQIIWKTKTEYISYINYSPLIAGGRVYLNVNWNSRMFIFNAADGNLDYLNTSLPNIYYWTLTYANGKVYSWMSINSSITLNEHDPTSGNINWTLGLPWYGPSTNAPLAISNRTAFVVSPLYLDAINLDTHTVLWTVDGSYENTFPAVDGNIVYAIQGNVLEARRISDGALQDSFTAPETLRYSPLVTSSQIYISSDTTTYILDRGTLEQKGSVPEGGSLSLSDGFLIIKRTNGYVSAYRAEER